jgi:hypothetical protein
MTTSGEKRRGGRMDDASSRNEVYAADSRPGDGGDRTSGGGDADFSGSSFDGGSHDRFTWAVGSLSRLNHVVCQSV